MALEDYRVSRITQPAPRPIGVCQTALTGRDWLLDFLDRRIVAIRWKKEERTQTIPGHWISPCVMGMCLMPMLYHRGFVQVDM